MLTILTLLNLVWIPGQTAAPDPQAAALTREVAAMGWVAYSGRGEGGTWDVFLCRPDGSAVRNITATAGFEEIAPRFSPDGSKLLFRRMEQGSVVDHDRWGFQGVLMLANADGGNARALGEDSELPWASWSPDGGKIACLTLKGIQIHSLATLEQTRQMPRNGIYQQLCWSPDGKWFCGVANHQGAQWTVVRMNAANAEVNAVREYQNCTPDWCPDSNYIVVSSRPAGQPANDGYGYTQLWMVSGDGADQRLVYGEDGFHIYGGCVSPDGQYVLFTKTQADGGESEKNGGPIGLMRMADAPSIGGESPDLRKVHPEANTAPVVYIGQGWEPHWTYAELGDAP